MKRRDHDRARAQGLAVLMLLFAAGLLNCDSGDVNGDGAPDMVIGQAGVSSVKVLLNNGNGTFTDGGAFPAGSDPVSVAITDLNGDGKPDLAAANLTTNTVTWLPNLCLP